MKMAGSFHRVMYALCFLVELRKNYGELGLASTGTRVSLVSICMHIPTLYGVQNIAAGYEVHKYITSFSAHCCVWCVLLYGCDIYCEWD